MAGGIEKGKRLRCISLRNMVKRFVLKEFPLYGCAMSAKSLLDYKGRRILLTDERMGHILEHPEMKGLMPYIQNALSKPSMVCQSLTDKKVELFYTMLPEKRVGVTLLCVVAKFPVEKDGFILTSYLTNKPKKGTLLWPKK